ncbi:putative transcription factor C3H family [Helianthus anomalus]
MGQMHVHGSNAWANGRLPSVENEDEDVSVDREHEHVQDLENQTKNVKAYHYPLRLDAEDCAYYIRTGMCKFGSNCKFNHPIRRKIQVIIWVFRIPSQNDLLSYMELKVLFEKEKLSQTLLRS